MRWTEFTQYLEHAQQNGPPPDLSGMRGLMAHLGDPQLSYACVHIAGTNGKGSTAALIESVLRRAGYVTGLFTSPHILHVNERIRVDGADIPDEALCALGERVQEAERALCLRLGYFQILTAIGFLYFAQMGCRAAVIETGLGGRLDPTNILDASVVAIIAHIGLDHMAALGDTVEKIAAEKAGIVKPGCDVVLLAQSPQAEAPVERACSERGARIHKTPALDVTLRDGGLYANTQMGALRIGLSGAYQAQNAALALAALRILREKGFAIPDEAVREGFALARWPGRFELLQEQPPLLLDGAHNPQGAQSLADSLRAYYPGRRCVFLMAAMRDKDAGGCLDAVAPLARAIVALPLDDMPRARDTAELAELMRARCARVYAAQSVEDGLRTALSFAQDGDVLCAFGSIFLAGPLRAAVEKIRFS